MKSIRTDDGVRLAFTDHGSGRPVVLIAGYGAPASSWFLQERALLKAGYRVICYDRRCHGASDKPAFGQTMLRHGRDLHCLLTELDLRNAVLVGQSQGASTIFAYIAQYGTERLAGIVDIDQTPKMLNEGDWPYGMRGFDAMTRPTYFDTPLAKPNNKPVSRRVMAKVLLSSLGRKAFDREGTRPLLLDHADADWLPVLPGIDVPALFIAGEKSPFWPCEHAEAASARCPNGAFTVIPDSGHAVNWEFPEEVNELLLRFLSGMVRVRELPGNTAEYAAENAPRHNSALAGRRVLFLGSSVTAGSGSCGDSFVDYLEKECGLIPRKEAVNGTLLANVGVCSYLRRLRALKKDECFDAFVCQLSTNDAARNIPPGHVSPPEQRDGFDEETVAGAIEAVCAHVKRYYGCPIFFYTNPRYNSPAYGALAEKLEQAGEKWGFTVIDFWSDHACPQEKRALYMADAVHPTRAGYRDWMTPVFEAALSGEQL